MEKCHILESQQPCFKKKMFWTKSMQSHTQMYMYSFHLETWFKFILYFLTTSTHTHTLCIKVIRAEKT